MLFALAIALQTSFAAAQTLPVEDMRIDARAITRFHIGTEETRFGPLEFVGGLSMSSGKRDFGGLSAFSFTTPGRDFIGVSDSGFWFFGRIERDREGRPTGIADFAMQPIADRSGQAVTGKENADAEGLAIRDGQVSVSFEREHRVNTYALKPRAMGAAAGEVDFLIPKRELRTNRGLETIAHAPKDGPLAGARVVVSEKSLDPTGNIFAAILEGPQKGLFKVRRSGDFDVTDGSFLPNGDLLILERKFSMAEGVAMRLRRLRAETIRKGGIADGPVVFDGGMDYQIDNMEGLDIWRRDDGALMLSLISDDNHSILQRNLYLEFRLVGE